MKTLISKGSIPISVDRWSMPVIPELYDRTPELSAAESAAIDSVVRDKFPKPETVRGIRVYRDLDRLLRPLQDVLSVTKPPCRRIHITVLSFMMREMCRRQQSFWGWSAEEWSETVTPNGQAFLKQTGRRPDIRKHLIAISYLLCGYSDSSTVDIRSVMPISMIFWVCPTCLTGNCPNPRPFSDLRELSAFA